MRINGGNLQRQLGVKVRRQLTMLKKGQHKAAANLPFYKPFYALAIELRPGPL